MSFAKDNIDSSCFHFNKETSAIEVEWDFKVDLGSGLINRWRGPFIQNLVSPDLMFGLNKLKAITEENASMRMKDLAEDQTLH